MDIRTRERLAVVALGAILGGGIALGLAFGHGPSRTTKAKAPAFTTRVFTNTIAYPPPFPEPPLRHQLRQLRSDCQGTPYGWGSLSTQEWLDAMVSGTTNFNFSGQRFHGLTFDQVPPALRRALGVHVKGSVDSDPLVFVGRHEVAVAHVKDGEIDRLIWVACRGKG